MSLFILDAPPAAVTAASSPPRRRFAAVLAYVPTLAVLGGLAALAAYGHSVHWKLPKFAELAGTTPPAAGGWCETHGVPEAECVECNPGKFPPGVDHGWCGEHGVHNCPLHHPDVAQHKERPEVSEGEVGRSLAVLALRERTKNNAACKLYQRRVQFATVEAVEQAGVDVELAERRPVSEWVAGNGEISYDATKVARLAPRVSGTAFRVLKNVGDPVREGDVLAVVDAVEVGRLKADLVKALVAEELARKNVDRLAGVTSGAIPGRQLIETEAALAQASAETLGAQQALANRGLRVELESLRGLSQQAVLDRLRFLGLPDGLARSLGAETATSNLIPVRSPLHGVVVERTAVAGEVVEPSQAMFQIVDPRTMWLTVNVPPEDADLLRLGQAVRFLTDGGRQEVTASLRWVSTAVDKRTRTVAARADLANEDGRLRGETFGGGRVMLRENEDAVVVPRAAVHWEGCCQVVFVRDKDYFKGPKVFHVRTVRTGAVNGDRVEIVAGVLPGEVVATAGSDVLRAQLLKGGLGAGCSCVE